MSDDLTPTPCPKCGGELAYTDSRIVCTHNLTHVFDSACALKPAHRVSPKPVRCYAPGCAPIPREHKAFDKCFRVTETTNEDGYPVRWSQWMDQTGLPKRKPRLERKPKLETFVRMRPDVSLAQLARVLYRLATPNQVAKAIDALGGLPRERSAAA